MYDNIFDNFRDFTVVSKAHKEINIGLTIPHQILGSG
jgi:hypothetical protein